MHKEQNKNRYKNSTLKGLKIKETMPTWGEIYLKKDQVFNRQFNVVYQGMITKILEVEKKEQFLRRIMGKKRKFD